LNTINRQIRRIGLLPTTFKEIPDGERKIKNAEGNFVVEKVTKQVPIRHSKALTTEEREALVAELKAADRSRHLKFRADRKAAKKKTGKKAA
jgi:hypothetical protein